MIVGIGTDITEVARIGQSLEKGNAFRDKVFSEREIAYCQTKGLTSFAGRFAVKEAFLKALGTGLDIGMKLNEIEILNGAKGKPVLSLLGETKVNLKRYTSHNIHVSISHTKSYATAVVVIEEARP